MKQTEDYICGRSSQPHRKNRYCLDPLPVPSPLTSEPATKEQPMSDTLPEREWCDDCHGYTHMPYCPSSESAKEASAHQPAARGGGDGELSVRDFDYHQYGDVTLNVTNNGITVAIAYMQGRGQEAKEWAEKIAAAYNHHQSLVAERKRLLTTLKLVVASYVRSDDHGVAAQAARDTLAAIKQRSTSE